MLLRSIAIASTITVPIILGIFVEVQPSNSQLSQVSNQEVPESKLEIVKNRDDLMRLNGQRVKLIGRYTSRSWKPNPESTGIPGFQGLYIKSQVVLEDETKVSIYPSWNKQSLRSPDEVEKYNNQIVEAIGVVQFDATPVPNWPTRESFINLTQLNLYQQ